MADLAIIKKGTQQYAMEVGRFLDLPHIEGKADDTIDFDEVLLVKKGDKIEIGTPLVNKAKVKTVIVKQFKTKKVEAMKFKAKSRYRKRWGFRSELTRLKVVEISL